MKKAILIIILCLVSVEVWACSYDEFARLSNYCGSAKVREGRVNEDLYVYKDINEPPIIIFSPTHKEMWLDKNYFKEIDTMYETEDLWYLRWEGKDED